MSDTSAQPSRRQAQIAPAATPEPSELATLAVAVVVIAALYLGREVLIPITLAVLLSFVLAPLVGVLRQAHLGRVPSVMLAMLLAVGIILSLGGVIGTQIATLAEELPNYTYTIQRKIETIRDGVLKNASGVVDRIGGQLQPKRQDTPPPAPRGTAKTAPGVPAAQPGQPQTPTPVVVQPPQPSPIDVAERVLTPIASPLATLGIVLVVAIFILLQQEELRDRLIRLFGSKDIHRTTAAMDDAARRLSRFFLTQLAINALFGCLITGGLFAIGVPSPVLFGIIAALMRFVPYVGTFVSGALPCALAAAVDPGWSMALWTFGLFLVSETIMGQVVEPILYGHSTGLAPISIVIAAIFWTWLWGPIGLILSTPLTLCLVVLGRHVDRLEFIDVILGDRPALTPVESLYQRLLAGDPDEAQASAELLLRDRPLSSYYDEVMVKGLRLAAVDAERGVMTDAQVEHVREAAMQLIEGLEDESDEEPDPERADKGAAGTPKEERELVRRPPPAPDITDRAELAPGWTGDAPVLCVGGRGALNETAAYMLAQLLGKHSLGARVVPFVQASRATVGALDVTGVAMAAVCYLEVSGSPSHLRYLIRRLRSRLPPGAPILVHSWPPEDAVLHDDRLRAAIGADFYATSLRDGVTACLVAARGNSSEQKAA